MENRKNRSYNIFFNTHTVTGIVISLGLFVIFFCGAFALFMKNIDHWEINKKNEISRAAIDYEGALKKVEEKGYDMHGRTFSISSHDNHINIFSQPLTDSTLVKSSLDILPDSVAKGNILLEFHVETLEDYDDTKEVEAHLGDYIYGLHYFRPIPIIGQYLSGLVAVFFLFAIITGIIIHWEKIRSNFFTFRLKSSLKNLWTDAHTALGVIGLPFQLMYAVTGAIFGLTILIFMPYMMIFFGGDQASMFETVYPDPAFKQYEQKGFINENPNLNELAELTLGNIPNKEINNVFTTVSNFKDKNAHFVISVQADLKSGFFNTVQDVYRVRDGELLHHKEASASPAYSVAVVEFIHKIHFADYGNYFVKLLYFLMALMTCFMITSGVMIWLKACDKKIYEHKKTFNTYVGASYLGLSMGLYQALALMFVLVKAVPSGFYEPFTVVAWFFGAAWLAYTIYAAVIKNYSKITRHALLLAGLIGILVPLANGIQSGLWFWKSLPLGYVDSFFIDVSWLVLSTVTLIVAFSTRPKVKKQKEILRRKDTNLTPDMFDIKREEIQEPALLIQATTK
ncbi:MAG: PepSY-associated TM helix domain-containing protein [Bacteroidota bacterium]